MITQNHSTASSLFLMKLNFTTGRGSLLKRNSMVRDNRHRNRMHRLNTQNSWNRVLYIKVK